MRRAIGIKERSLGPQHLDLAYIRANLVLVLIDRGRAAEAVALSEQALDTITRSNGLASIAQSERQQLGWRPEPNGMLMCFCPVLNMRRWPW